MNRYNGSNFDDFLREERILEEVSERARKQTLALQIRNIISDYLNEKIMSGELSIDLERMSAHRIGGRLDK